MQIAGYLKTSLIEWTGKIAAVIFVPGCNFRCPFCHNADLVRNRGLIMIDEKQIFTDLKKRKKWVDGIVVSGGEPTLQPDFPQFLRKIKKMGFLTMIETNGSKPEVIAELLNGQMVDFVAMDVKGPFDEYDKFINIPARLASQREAGRQYPVSGIKCSMETIVKSGIDFEFRTTVVPGLHDERILIKMAEELKSLVQSSKCKIQSYKWYLQNFQPKNCLDQEFEKRKSFTKEELEDFLNAVKKIIPQTKLREG